MMESLEGALRYVVGLAKPETQVVDGTTYWTSDHKPVRLAFPPALQLYSLSALAEYIKSHEGAGLFNLFAIVDSPERVTLHLPAEGISRREVCTVVREQASDRFRFGEWYLLEEFTIKLQAQFLYTTARATLLQVLGNITGDDGVTQRVATRVGAALADTATIANPVLLAPFRTFPEIAQPESPFILRIRGTQEKTVALFEADGGAWRNTAVESIRQWLKKKASTLVVLG